MTEDESNPADALKPLVEAMPNTAVAPAHGIAAIALTMAMKYHDINTVQDGTLFQQYKLDGRNMEPLHIDMVFETAIKIERHLLASSERIAALVVDALKAVVDDAAAESTLPRTKTVEVWHVEFVDMRLEIGDGPYPHVNCHKRESSARGRAIELSNSKRDGVPMYTCIRVTGPHQQEVPA